MQAFNWRRADLNVRVMLLANVDADWDRGRIWESANTFTAGCGLGVAVARTIQQQFEYVCLFRYDAYSRDSEL